jgi:hypothetical protein
MPVITRSKTIQARLKNVMEAITLSISIDYLKDKRGILCYAVESPITADKLDLNTLYNMLRDLLIEDGVVSGVVLPVKTDVEIINGKPVTLIVGAIEADEPESDDDE